MTVVTVRVLGLTLLEILIDGDQLAADDAAPAVVSDVNLVTFDDVPGDR